MQFKLTFALSEPLTLPLSYHSALQGMIYHVLSDAPEFSAFLHDDGYTRNRRAYKLFVFGALEGPYRVHYVSGAAVAGGTQSGGGLLPRVRRRDCKKRRRDDWRTPPECRMRNARCSSWRGLRRRAYAFAAVPDAHDRRRCEKKDPVPLAGGQGLSHAVE